MSDQKSDWPTVVLILGILLGPTILIVLAKIFGGA